MTAGATAGAAAAAAAIANAVKASGLVVKVEPVDFFAILKRSEEPVIVIGRGGVFRKHFQYLTTYKGLGFFTKSDSALVLPPHAEIIAAKSISFPDI